MLEYVIYKNSFLDVYIYSENDKLEGLYFTVQNKGTINESNELLIQVKKELDEYFKGERKVFSPFPLLLKGSKTRIRIYQELMKVPYGQTYSYQKLAELAGNKKMARAIGTAMKENKFPIILPCHRIIKADGTLGYYSGPEGLKKRLINLEKKAM